MSATEIQDKLEEFTQKCLKEDQHLHDTRSFWRRALMFGCDIPYDAFRGTQYHSIAEQVYNNESNEWELDEQATIKKIAAYIQFARENGYKVEKKYSDDQLDIYIEVPDVKGKFNLYSTRQVVCKKVQVGTKIIEAVEEHEEPVYEYQCNKVAFLAVEL